MAGLSGGESSVLPPQIVADAKDFLAVGAKKYHSQFDESFCHSLYCSQFFVAVWADRRAIRVQYLNFCHDAALP